MIKLIDLLGKKKVLKESIEEAESLANELKSYFDELYIPGSKEPSYLEYYPKEDGSVDIMYKNGEEFNDIDELFDYDVEEKTETYDYSRDPNQSEIDVMYLYNVKRKSTSETLDPVGKEDDDINNDGKVDKIDKYLSARRKAISANVKKEVRENPLSDLYDLVLELIDQGIEKEQIISIVNFAASKSDNLDEGMDHEVSMAVSSLEAIAEAIVELRQKLGNQERNIPGWIQDHIAKAENYIEQAAQGFHELKSDE